MQIKRHLNAIAISLTGAAMMVGTSSLAARHSATTAAQVGLQESAPNIKMSNGDFILAQLAKDPNWRKTLSFIDGVTITKVDASNYTINAKPSPQNSDKAFAYEIVRVKDGALFLKPYPVFPYNGKTMFVSDTPTLKVSDPNLKRVVILAKNKEISVPLQ